MSHSWWRAAFIMLIALILDDKLPYRVAIAGIGPDLALIGLFVVTLRYGPRVGVWAGFLSGLFMDVATPEDLGARALSLALASFLLGRTAEHVDVGSPIVQLILIALMGAIDGGIYEAASHISQPAVAFSRFFGRHIPGLLYTAGVALLLFRLFGRRLLPLRLSWREVP